jgi:disulfide oxidoreductase YuzD
MELMKRAITWLFECLAVCMRQVFNFMDRSIFMTAWLYGASAIAASCICLSFGATKDMYKYLTIIF